MMKNLSSILRPKVLLLILTLLFSFLFFFRLDNPTLKDWDEAWYASISRNIVRTGNLFSLQWYGGTYTDHPPLGFWLMATSYKLFGINEFSTRFPSALLGLLSIILIYKIGEKLFQSKPIGFAAALILGTSAWYILRVRSGNLDSTLVFFYLLTIYLAIKSSKKIRYLPWTMLSYSGLLLTKTLVGAPTILLILFLNWHHLKKLKKNIRTITYSFILFVAAVFPWYFIQYLTVPKFLPNFFKVGTRNSSLASLLKLKLEQPLFYFHMGIRKWYYPWIYTLTYLVITFRWLKKEVFLLLVWLFITLFPFLTNQSTEIWHLIPAYPPMALIIAYSVYDIGLYLFRAINTIIKKINFLPLQSLLKENLFNLTYILIFLIAASIQFKNFYQEIIPPADKHISDEVDISLKSKHYEEKLYLDDEFLPVATFYSDKEVILLKFYITTGKKLVKLFSSGEINFIVVTRTNNVEELEKEGIVFNILESNKSFLIITKPKIDII